GSSRFVLHANVSTVWLFDLVPPGCLDADGGVAAVNPLSCFLLHLTGRTESPTLPSSFPPRNFPKLSRRPRFRSAKTAQVCFLHFVPCKKRGPGFFVSASTKNMLREAVFFYFITTGVSDLEGTGILGLTMGTKPGTIQKNRDKNSKKESLEGVV